MVGRRGVVVVTLGGALALSSCAGHGARPDAQTTPTGAVAPRTIPMPSPRQVARGVAADTNVSAARRWQARQARRSRMVQVTVADVRPGLGVVGLTRNCCGYEGTRPPRLLISTNLRTWRNITPPGARLANPGHGYSYFEHVSFLNSQIGWVESWNPGTVGVRIYRTIDGGVHWSSTNAGTHTASAGGTTLIDALSAATAYRDTLQPTGESQDLAVTTDGGTHWHSVFTEPPGVGGRRLRGPYEMAPLFLTPSTGFAADGISLNDNPLLTETAGYLFVTHDGGRRWARLEAPRAVRCRGSVVTGVSCPYGLPTFSDADNAILPYVVRTNKSASVGFDTTVDGGRTWQIAAYLRLPTSSARPQPADAYIRPGTYPLVSIASAQVWWVAVPTASGFELWRTTDAGHTWSRRSHIDFHGRPDMLQALGPNRAWMTATVGQPNAMHDLLFTTSDAGRHWRQLPAIDRDRPGR
jgi:photosystem II stability/assembly factor-like uncharacterized protein